MNCLCEVPMISATIDTGRDKKDEKVGNGYQGMAHRQSTRGKPSIPEHVRWS